ncbi:MAG: Trk system potassium transporter TrkA, partial [Eubacterium sp.]|nr:Trk system potassium transporter TrkA [Eubacterium sp.]
MDVAIVGCGKLGCKVAEALADGDYAVTLIDKDDIALERMAQQLDVMTVNEDARKISVFEELGIENFEFLLAATGNDERNIVIASFAKKLGCKHVIARVRDPEHMNQFEFIKEAMEIDSIVNPDMAITVEIYKYLVEKYALSNGMFTSGKIALTEFPAEKYQSLIGLTITDIREVMPDIIIAAISRAGKVILPKKNDEIQDNDILYAIGDKKVISQLHKKIHEEEPARLNNVMIIGGGKTGFYLAQKLEEYGTSVKIVEHDLDRCRYLSTNLNNVMVLHGEGTDIDLLEEENMDSMDAFITATGYDEENLLLALTAKKHGISDVISKVSH